MNIKFISLCSGLGRGAGRGYQPEITGVGRGILPPSSRPTPPLARAANPECAPPSWQPPCPGPAVSVGRGLASPGSVGHLSAGLGAGSAPPPSVGRGSRPVSVGRGSMRPSDSSSTVVGSKPSPPLGQGVSSINPPPGMGGQFDNSCEPQTSAVYDSSLQQLVGRGVLQPNTARGMGVRVGRGSAPKRE